MSHQSEETGVGAGARKLRLRTSKNFNISLHKLLIWVYLQGFTHFFAQVEILWQWEPLKVLVLKHLLQVRELVRHEFVTILLADLVFDISQGLKGALFRL